MFDTTTILNISICNGNVTHFDWIKFTAVNLKVDKMSSACTYFAIDNVDDQISHNMGDETLREAATLSLLNQRNCEWCSTIHRK